MLRNLFLCLLSFSVLPVLAQSPLIQDDFEGNGTITTWFGDDCGMDNAFANPFVEGINLSATVLKYTDSGGTYANVRFDLNGNFDLSGQANFSLKIYVPANGLSGSQSNQISLKLQNGTLNEPWSTQSEIIKPLVLDQWQVINFDFANDPYVNLDPNSADPVTRIDFNRVLLQVNGENNTDQVIAYLDDFLFEGTAKIDPVYNLLVWSDEFEGTGAVDTSKWFHQTQLPDGVNWYNGELQHYTDRLDNSYVDGGFLHIVAKKETFTDQGQTKTYTSARLNSKFAFTYGRVEVRARLPFGQGTWPAIWSLGKNIIEPGAYWTGDFGTVAWPACGEIDIMEHWGYNQNYVQSALHTPSSFGNTVNLGGVLATDVSNQFHVYGLEWTPEKMKFSIDGNVYYTYAPDPKDPDNWPFTADQYLLLNVAMVGAVTPSFTQSPMVIDYVRVFAEGSATSLSDPTALPAIRLFPNPVDKELNIELPENLRGATIKVYAADGQVVDSLNVQANHLQMDWSSYPRGTYLMVFATENGQFTYQVWKK